MAKKEEDKKNQARNEQRQKAIQRVKEYMEVGVSLLVPSCARFTMVGRVLIAEEPGRGEAATSTLPEAIPKAGSWAQGEQVPPICRTHCSAHNIQEQFCCKHHSWCI